MPPRPTAGSWCRSPTSATRAPASSAMVSSARAVSWSSIPASSTTSRSPGRSTAAGSGGSASMRVQGRRRPSATRAGGPARPPRTRRCRSAAAATRAAFKVGVTTTIRCPASASASARRPGCGSSRRRRRPRPPAASRSPASAATASGCATIQPAPVITAARLAAAGRRLFGAVGEPDDQVGLDRQHLAGGQCSDVLGHARSGQQGPRRPGCPGSEVLGQLDPHRRLGDQPGGGDPRSTSPRMSAAFHADRRAPSRASTISTAWSRSSAPGVGPVPTGSRGAGSLVAQGVQFLVPAVPTSSAPLAGRPCRVGRPPTPVASQARRNRGPGSWPGFAGATRLRSGRRSGRSARLVR